MRSSRTPGSCPTLAVMRSSRSPGSCPTLAVMRSSHTPGSCPTLAQHLALPRATLCRGAVRTQTCTTPGTAAGGAVPQGLAHPRTPTPTPAPHLALLRVELHATAHDQALSQLDNVLRASAALAALAGSAAAFAVAAIGGVVAAVPHSSSVGCFAAARQAVGQHNSCCRHGLCRTAAPQSRRRGSGTLGAAAADGVADGVADGCRRRRRWALR
eukprot:365825-Chlamydomonas_euryale.AAC.3